jgi:hypothetical protein
MDCHTILERYPTFNTSKTKFKIFYHPNQTNNHCCFHLSPCCHLMYSRCIFFTFHACASWSWKMNEYFYFLKTLEVGWSFHRIIKLFHSFLARLLENHWQLETFCRQSVRILIHQYSITFNRSIHETTIKSSPHHKMLDMKSLKYNKVEFQNVRTKSKLVSKL